MAHARRDLMVGVVFLIGFTLVAIFTIVIKDVTFFSTKKQEFVVLFERVSGLEVGHKVLASGTEVGQVREMKLQEDGKVRVIINLVQPIHLYPGYQVVVKDASALGGKYVDISVGNPQEAEIPLREIDVHKGIVQPSLFDDPNLRETFVSLRKIAQRIQSTLEDEDSQGTLALLLTQRDLYDDLLDTSENLKDITNQIKNTEGTVGRLLYERELAEDISATVKNVRVLTEDLQVIADDAKDILGRLRKGEGTAGKLLKDDSLYRDTEKVMNNLAKITDKIRKGKGTIGKLLVEDEMYTELQKTLAEAQKMMKNMNEAVETINHGEGTLGVLLRDREMAENLKDTLAHLKVVAQRLEKGEGTVGKLLADEALYNELQKVIKNFSDSLEDTREQVPITTFTNVLFKAF